MQGHTYSTPRFGQNHVRMRTTSLTWATTVKKGTMDSCHFNFTRQATDLIYQMFGKLNQSPSGRVQR